jgi:hypothetical protein
MQTTSLPRTFVLSLALACACALGGVTAAAADATPAAAATEGGVAQPPVNVTFLGRASDLASKLVGEAQGQLNNAKSVGSALGGLGSLGGAGSKASSTVASAQSTRDEATGLKSDLDALRAGKPISSTGVFATLTSAASSGGSGGSGIADKFKGLAAGPVVQAVLGNQDLVKSVVAGLPVDKVPGYQAASDALKNAGL